MPKRIASLALSIISLLSIIGCSDNNITPMGSRSNAVMTIVEPTQMVEESYMQENNSTESAPMEEESVSAEDLICFSSIEEFSRYLKEAEEGGDIADLASLTEYCIPTSIPDGYSLYKITAGIVDIGFWYLPDELLASEESIADGEAAQQHFLFLSPRRSMNMDDVKEQLGFGESDLIEEKYFVHQSATNAVFWEDDGKVCILYLPRDFDLSENSGGDVEAMYVNSYSAESIIYLCQTKKITVNLTESAEYIPA